MGDSSTLNWSSLGTITPAVGWLSTAPTDANVFKFEHHNPPPHTLLQVTQTDGLLWLFEPLVISSDTSSQVLVLPNSPIFGGQRRISLRYANPASKVTNWTVTVSATTLDLTATADTLLMALQSAIANLATQETQIQAALTSISDRDTQILSQLNTLAQAPSSTGGTGGTGNTGGGSTTAQSAAGVAYTASQSSVPNSYDTVVGTYASLTDMNGSTGAGCGSSGVNEWIKATYSQPVIVHAVQVGGGYITYFGPVASQLNGSTVQYSTDNTNWTDAVSISGVSDSGASQFPTFTLSNPITAQYWRILGRNYMATSEFILT